MKRPPQGAEKREDYLSFCPLASVFLSVCLFIFLSFSGFGSSPLNQLGPAHSRALVRSSKETQFGSFHQEEAEGEGERRRAMRAPL